MYRKMSGVVVTAYTPFPCCNGKYGQYVATGKTMRHYTDRGIRIVAVDTRVIPFYSCIIYQGREYFALDRGRLIKGKSLDIHFPIYSSKKKAIRAVKKFGRRKGQKIKILVERKIGTRFKQRFYGG